MYSLKYLWKSQGGCPYVLRQGFGWISFKFLESLILGKGQWLSVCVRQLVACECLCGFGGWCVVEGAVAEHGEEHVAAAPGEGDECLVVALSFGAFPVVVGA